jgi:hypothetical protein
MFDKIEQILPQWAIAAIAIAIAVAVIMYNGSEYTVCDSQREMLVQAQNKFLASEYYQVYFERCLRANRPGACEPYFSGMRDLMNHLAGYVEPQCVNKVIVQNKFVQGAMYNFLLEVTRLAWGDEGPSSIYARQSWLEGRHLKTFCSVQAGFQAYFGEAIYQSVEKDIISKLPEKGRQDRFIQKKEKTLFGVNCSQYM